MNQAIEFFGYQQKVKPHGRIGCRRRKLSARPGHIFEMLGARWHAGPQNVPSGRTIQ
jgi:hypothetical protein